MSFQEFEPPIKSPEQEQKVHPEAHVGQSQLSNPHPFLASLERKSQQGLPNRFHEINEGDFLERIKTDPETFTELYDRYFGYIFASILRKVGNVQDAEDLTSITLTKVYKALSTGQYKHRGMFEHWLSITIRNQIVSFYRQPHTKNPTIELTETHKVPYLNQPEEYLLRAIDREDLKKVLQSLRPSYRQIIVLRFVEELSHREIGQLTNRTEGATRLILLRALKAAKKIAEKQGINKDSI